MRTLHSYLLLFCFLSSAVAVEGRGHPDERGRSYVASERGPHHTVWSTVTAETNLLGSVTYRTNSYTELASGLNRLRNGQWVAAAAQIVPAESGAIGSGGQHTVVFAGNINRRGSVRIKTPEGEWLKSHLLGLAYHDSGSGTNVWIAELKDSTGELVNSNEIIYRNAFSGVQADVRYRYRAAGLEQDIILRRRPPAPEQFGLDPATTYLWAVTEFVETPSPKIEERSVSTVREHAKDQTISFGSMHTAAGRAFGLHSQAARWKGAPVFKTWETWEGRTVLVERVKLSQVQDELFKLQRSGSTNNLAAIAPETRWFAKGSLPVGEKLTEEKPMRVKAMAEVKQENGFVLDYDLVTSADWWDFSCGNTYLIKEECHLSLGASFEPGAILKYDANGSLYLDGPFYWAGDWDCDGLTQAVITSAGDDTVGFWVPRSSCPPCSCSSGPALVVRPGDIGTATAAITGNGYSCLSVVAADPFVTVAPTDRFATKGTSDEGKFTISREEGDWSQSLTVFFTLEGTAVQADPNNPNTGDYEFFADFATIPEDEGSVDIAVLPSASGYGASLYDASVVLTIVPGTGYSVGNTATGTVSIIDPSVLPPAGTPMPSGCVAWWRGENNPNDSIGGNNGQLPNGLSYSYGKSRQAFSLDGADYQGTHIRVPDNSVLDFTAMTVEAWIYPIQDGTYDSIVVKWDATGSQNQRSYTFSRNPDNRVVLGVSSDGTDAGADGVYSIDPIPKEKWTHVAGTYDGAKLRLYVDGVAQGDGVLHGGGIFSGTDALGIGGCVGGASQGSVISPFGGLIDEVAMYDRPLSQSEIQNIYTAGRGGKRIDTDSDGLPDDWETTYFGNLVPTGNIDSDGDGLTNIEEWTLGTNPAISDLPGGPTGQVQIHTPLQ